VAEKNGALAVMTDPHLPSGTDRVWAALRNTNCDVAVNVQGDEPLVTGELIDLLAAPFAADPSLQMATLAHPLDENELQNPNAVKVLLDQNQDAIYFSRFPIPFSRIDARHFGTANWQFSSVLKHIGMYAYKKSFLERFCAAPPAEIERAEALEQLRALHLGVRIRVVPVNQRLVGVDTPEDAKRVEQLLK
jgi:3-deoxy-manno-octulosonate cytidylyltransferase (CMP-KDO synthetase)